MTVTDDAWLDELEQQGARAAEATEERDLLAGLRNGAWLHEQTFPPLKYHLPGVIPEGSTLLVGPPKIGKSWFVLALALATSCGGRALGQQVDARPTLYLALEDGDRRMQDRCRVLLGDDPIPAAFEYLTVIEPMTILATLTAWMDRYPGAEPLAIVDTLGRVMPPALMGESAYQRDYRVGAALKALTDERPGAGLVVNHHDRKAASEDFVEKVSGSNGLAGAADTILVLARARHEQTGIINVTGRDGPEGEYAVTFDGNHGAWSLDGDTLVSSAARAVERRTSDGLDERSRSIVAYAAEHPEGVRAAQVAAAVGIDEGRARQYLGRLVDSDRLVRVTRGLYTAVANVALSRSDHAPVSSGHQASRQRDKRDTRDTPMSGRRHRASRGGHMTTITVIGNASRDPELRYTPNGAGVATFGLAVNRRKKDGDKWVEAGVAWFNVTCWRDPRPERLRLDREGHARRGGRPP